MATAFPPSIAELTAAVLGRTADAEVLACAADALGDVEPHEVAVGYRAEPRLAWKESLAVLDVLGKSVHALSAPAEWGTLVARQAGTAALPFALGNYPQRVRDLGTLLTTETLGDLLPANVENTEVSTGLLKWGVGHIKNGNLPHALIAAANYRAAGDFDRADAALTDLASTLPAEWRDVLANEKAAILWHRGRHAEAAAQWARLPASVPVSFNRGMASLFLGDFTTAKTHLAAAVAGLSEESAWHHLASLYLNLAEMRG